jgi:hypothetical protein
MMVQNITSQDILIIETYCISEINIYFLGQIVLSKIIDKSDMIDVSNLKGNYLITVLCNEKFIVKKIYIGELLELYLE